MPLGRQKDISRTIAQSSSSNTSCLPSNNNKIDDNEHLQSTNMSSNNKTTINQENFSLLVRLKVRFTYCLFFFFLQFIELLSNH